jgi:predicted Zn-dependent protease
MTENMDLDEKIGLLVRSVRKDIPAGLEEKIREAASSLRPASVARPERQRRMWLPVVTGAAAAAVVLAMMFGGPFLPKRAGSKISEIRTQFELVDKNITIVFIQKPDFKLNLEE